ncbi:MAG TPA: SBBP repeat-containing protein, partial [Chitinophagales bacterium]|nr:SBBP repeat-containing protein [Chitinophagales bacterium]
MGKRNFTLKGVKYGYAMLLTALVLMWQSSAAQQSKKLSDEQLQQVVGTGNSSIAFIENKGQWPSDVLFRADVPGGQMLATPDGMLIGAYDPQSLGELAEYDTKLEAIDHGLMPGMTKRDLGPAPILRGHGWRFNFIGGNKATAASMDKTGISTDYYNYLVPGQAYTGVHSFDEITYRNVYSGVNVKYYTGDEGSLENDIIVQPGADASQIKIQMDGISDLKLNEDGDIILPTSIGDMKVPSPVSYLVDANGKHTPIKITYRLTGKNTLTFDIPAYDKKQTLVIDPIVMRWATMISNNASADSHCHGIDVDGSGYIYVTGKYQNGLITVGAFQTSTNGNYDLFVGKYQEPSTPGNSGTRVWQTYLGASSSDNPYALTIGLDGYLYITGPTSSNWSKTYGSGFTAGGWTQRQGSTGGQSFIIKMDPNGNGALVRVIGTSSADLGLTTYDLRVYPTGGNNFDLIAVGSVNQQSGTSADGDVPAPTYPNGTTATSGNGHGNGYAVRFTSDLSTLKWTKQYTSNNNNNFFSISVVDNSGNIDIGGYTNGSSNISYNNPSGQTTLGGNLDGWLLQLNQSTGNCNWSRYYNSGSGKSTQILCMEVNSTKTQFFIGGITSGLGSVNVTSGTLQTSYAGGSHDFFVASLPVSGAATTWGTYVGGSGNEVNMMGLNVDQNNDVYVLGYTDSKNFTTAANPVQTNTYDNSNNDAVFFKLTGSTGATLQYSTYLGGSNDDYDPIGERGIKFNDCRIYLAITTNSNDFPLTQNTLTSDRLSSTNRGEPILVSMSNPPDLTGNSITGGGNQTLTCGQTPAPITAGVASYLIPTIIRNQNNQTNGSSGAYPSGLPTISSYQWQISYDSGATWASISGANGQNYTPGELDSASATWFRRIVNNDACNRASDTLAVVRIIVTPTLPAPTLSNNSPICAGQTLQLNSNSFANETYNWSGPNGFASTLQNPTISNASTLVTGTYTMTLRSTINGCPSYPGTTTATVNAVPSAPTVGSNSPVCQGGTINLTASGQSGASYSWTGPNSYSSGTQNPSITNATTANSGTYLVTQTLNGCTSSAASTTVTVNSTAAPTSVSASPNTLCSGGTLTLTATALGGYTLHWSFPDGGTATGSPVTRTNVTTAMGGTYTVYQTNGTCTSGNATVNVTINQTPSAPTFTALPNPVCTGGSLVLTASGQSGATFTWTFPDAGGTTGNPITRSNVTSAMGGNYSVTQTVNGCTSPASTNVNVVVNTTPTIGSVSGVNPTTCGGTTGTITITGLTNGQTYTVNYSKNSIAQTPVNLTASSGQVVITGLGAGSYSNFTVTLNGCTSSPFNGPVVLSDPTTPLAPTVSNNGPVCAGSTLSLTASGQGGATYHWTGPNSFTSNSQNPTVSANATTGMSGSYCATQTVNGCTSPQACTTATVNPLPTFTVDSTSGPTTCNGSNGYITIGGLTVGQTYTVNYQRNGVSQTPVTLTANSNGRVTISGLNAGNYTNIVVTLGTCSSSPSSGTITLSDPITPSAPTVGSNSPVCSGNTINLTASGVSGATYSWNGPNGYASTTQNPSITNATTAMTGSYCATQTKNGCTSPSACVTVTVNQTPAITGTSNTNPTTCGGSDGKITLNGLVANTQYSVTYAKNTVPQGPVLITANGTGQVVISGLTAGAYTNIVVTLNGCSSSPLGGTITLSDPTTPSAPSVSSNGPVCSGTTLTLNASGVSGATYAWTGPNSFTSTTQNPTVSTS